MFSFLAFITNKKYWMVHSWIVKAILQLKGVQVGRGFYIEGTPKLKIRGQAANIVFGENVSILGDIDLRNRENGKIIFKDNVTVEESCRFVSARDGVLEFGEGSVVTAFAIINGGADVIVGKQVIIGPRASINANEHRFERNVPVRKQGFIHENIHIEDDCWLAANVVIMKGVRVRKGSVVGAGSVVTRDTEEYSINAGVPSKKLSERK